MGNQFANFHPMNNLAKHRDHFPAASLAMLAELCEGHAFDLKLSRPRVTKLGDFKTPLKGKLPEITVNSDINSFHFLFIFLHEFAHLLVFEEYGRRVKPHGKEWQRTFADVLSPFVRVDIFPEELVAALSNFVQNPKATSYADIKLLELFRKYDLELNANLTTLSDLDENKVFQLENGRVFRKVKKLRSRFLCKEHPSGRLYFIHGHAMVTLVS